MFFDKIFLDVIIIKALIEAMKIFLNIYSTKKDTTKIFKFRFLWCQF